MLAKKRNDFDMAKPLNVFYFPHPKPFTINSALALFDPFFSELRYPGQLKQVDGIGPDDVRILDALVAELRPFVGKTF
jgi:hypothetical protein